MLGGRFYCAGTRPPGILPGTKNPLSPAIPAHTQFLTLSPFIPALTHTPGGGGPSYG